MKASGWVSGLLIGAGVVGVAWSRPEAAYAYDEAGKTTETYALPTPEHLALFSLGYRAALADLLFGRTLVAAGIHFVERRVFDELDAYLNAIVGLEPLYRDVYYYADALLTLSTVEMPKRNYRLARDLETRGLALFPDDGPLWMNAGQFVAYLAPPYLPPEENPSEWRVAGAQMMAHACTVWPPGEVTPRGCVSAAGALDKAGEVDAAVSVLERLLAVSDDPETRAQAQTRLNRLLGMQRADEMNAAMRAVGQLQSKDLPFVSRALYQMLIPPFDPARCLGAAPAQLEKECATSFRAWDERRRLPR